MRSKWHIIPAREFCSSVRDGTHDSPKPAEDGRYLITSRHIVGGRLDLADAYRISQSDFDDINKRSKVDRWDVLLSMIGTVGEPCLVREEPNFAIKNIGLFKNRSETEGKWLYYFLRSPHAQQLIRTQSRGSTQEYIPLGALREFPILAPADPHEMNAITDILGSMDDKIELNRRTNETLEAMARAIFKSWFGEFDPVVAKAAGRQPDGMDTETAKLFPSSFEESEIGRVPKGWKVLPLGAVCERIFSGGTPSTENSDYWGGVLPWLSSGETRSGYVVKTEKTITEAGASNSSTRLARTGSSVIASAGQGHTRGQTSLLALDTYINQSVIVLNADQHFSSDYYLFYDLERRYEEFRQLSDSHSSRGSLTTKLLAGIQTVVPPRNVVEAFDLWVSTTGSQIIANLRQSDTLAMLRDGFLPRLLSGELAVPAKRVA